jgi:hypothetical protein
LSLVTWERPRTHPVLYPLDETPKAVPKYISGRTSYLRVRLAFHRYPQLIRAVFNRHRCGPPAAVRPPSPWPWVDHSVSGRRSATERPVQTCFRCGCGGIPLNLATDRHSPVHSAKGTPSDRYTARRRAMVLRQLVSKRFQVLFHSPPGVLFTFPSRYWFTIGGREYLAFGGGPPEFIQGFSCPGLLGVSVRSGLVFDYRAVTVSGPAFQRVHLTRPFLTSVPDHNPAHRPHDPDTATLVGLARYRFRLAPVRSPLLGGSRLLSLPRGTKMFQFPRLPPSLTRVTAHNGGRVTPFGPPRITAGSRLPGASRRAPRPSSALCP